MRHDKNNGKIMPENKMNTGDGRTMERLLFTICVLALLVVSIVPLVASEDASSSSVVRVNPSPKPGTFTIGPPRPFIPTAPRVIGPRGEFVPPPAAPTTTTPNAAPLSGSSSFLGGATNFLEGASQYTGLGGFSSFFLDKEFLSEWRNSVEKFFAENYLGSEYWASAICSSYADGVGEGIIFADTPGGLAQFAAFVRGSRTMGATNEKGETEFIYRFEANVRNGASSDDEDAPNPLRFNMIVRGDRQVNIFSQPQSITPGGRFKRVGTSSIVGYSTHSYYQVCLQFETVPARWRMSGNELCSTIKISAGAPSLVTAVPPPGASSGGGGGVEMNSF